MKEAKNGVYVLIIFTFSGGGGWLLDDCAPRAPPLHVEIMSTLTFQSSFKNSLKTAGHQFISYAQIQPERVPAVQSARVEHYTKNDLCFGVSRPLLGLSIEIGLLKQSGN